MRLVIRFAIVALALVAAQQAAAVGPWLWTVDGGSGIAAPGGDVRYVTQLAGSATKVSAIRRTDGRTLRSVFVPGSWGLQAVTLSGDLAGLSRNGRLLILTPPTRGEPLATSTFFLVHTPALTKAGPIRLDGDYTVDTLSPDGQTLYLIQHVVGPDVSSYQVRAYDLRARKLLRRVVADKRQAGWTMRGYPVTRATDKTGGRVYTLYQNTNSYPFIHALDTVAGTAVCIGLPLSRTDPNILENVTLTLSHGDRMLTVRGPRLASPISIDTHTFQITSDR